MSGHSKWSTIKHKKAATDAKRGKAFTKLAKDIAIAAREGGGDPAMNPSLALAVEKAKAANMPKDNIERAIKRGTGEDKDGAALERITYEGYAGGGIALMIETITDNRNRTVAELRNVLHKAGGSLGEAGSVAWQFSPMSFFNIPAEGRSFDAIFELAADAGAEDVEDEDGYFAVYGPAAAFKLIGDRLRAAGIQTETAELRMFPNQEMEIAADQAVKVLRVIETLEELDDVQRVDSNMAITDAALELLEA
jgi:YebC/PmpR family DNA-binding regulatory protein